MLRTEGHKVKSLDHQHFKQEKTSLPSDCRQNMRLSVVLSSVSSVDNYIKQSLVRASLHFVALRFICCPRVTTLHVGYTTHICSNFLSFVDFR